MGVADARAAEINWNQTNPEDVQPVERGIERHRGLRHFLL
jgi:hypothetical protein